MRKLILAAWLVSGLAHADAHVVLDPQGPCSDALSEQYEFAEYRTIQTTTTNPEFIVIIHRCLSQTSCPTVQGAVSAGYNRYTGEISTTMMTWTVGGCHLSGN